MSGGGPFTAPSVEDLQPRFNQYHLEKLVAVGGMGAVYRATQVSVDRPIALKILPPDLAEDEQFRSRFEMEAKAMARLSHRNLVQLYDFGEAGGIVYMIQEWIDGQTVYEIIRDEHRLGPTEAAALVAQACEGLAYAHNQGVVHRDVKPANMMVNSEGILKLTDFGLARSTKVEGPRSSSGARFATEEYAAPELWDLEATIDHRVDIFALGVLLYELLTGERPTGTFKMPSEWRPELDRRYDEIVVRAMQRDPDARYGSCEEFMTALKQVASAPKVRLQTGAAPRKPASGPLLQTPPAEPARSPVVGPASPKKTLSTGLVAGLAALFVVGVLTGAWFFFQEDTPPGPTSPPDQAGVLDVPDDPEPAEPVDTPAEPERLAGPSRPPGEPAAPEPEPEPDKPVEPTPDPPARPAGAQAVLADVDEDLRTRIAPAFRAYEGERSKIEPKYLEECDRQEKSARAAGNLDLVLFWQAEARAIRETGDPPAGNAEGDVPEKAVALRAAWSRKLDPLKGPLVPIQSHYVEMCDELAGGAESEADQGVFRARRDAAKDFHCFLALCAGTAPPFPERTPVPDEQALVTAIEAHLPGDMQQSYTKVTERLAALARAGDQDARSALIRKYGRKLVTDERDLTRKGEIVSAQVVRRIKNEMLVLLGGAPAKGPEGEPTPARERLVIVERGAPSDECRFERKHWRRRGRALTTTGTDSENSIYPALASTRGIGRGDFRLTARLTVGAIGATGLKLIFGETFLHLDDENGQVVLQRCGASVRSVTGKNLGGLVQAGTSFECVVERKGTALTVLFDGKEGLAATIHDRELGAVQLRAGSASVEVADLGVTGGIFLPPTSTVLARYGAPGSNKGVVQLVPTGDRGLTALFVAEDGNGANELWARRSRDGGVKWDDSYEVLDDEVLSQSITSLAAGCNERRDEITLVVATGRANHQLYLMKGRNGGRNWSRPTDITAAAKKPGWNVHLGAQGVVLKRMRNKEGRVVLPLLVGSDEQWQPYVLITDDGREWKTVGPLASAVRSSCELMEDGEGTLWSSVGVDGATRQLIFSRDGGDTWSEPAESTLPDGRTRGSLAFGTGPGSRPVWYYAATKPVVDENGGHTRTHLTLYGSRDSGKTWQALKRVHFGTWKYPTVVSLGPNRCGVCFHRSSYSWSGDQIRYVEAADLWPR